MYSAAGIHGTWKLRTSVFTMERNRTYEAVASVTFTSSYIC